MTKKQCSNCKYWDNQTLGKERKCFKHDMNTFYSQKCKDHDFLVVIKQKKISDMAKKKTLEFHKLVNQNELEKRLLKNG